MDYFTKTLELTADQTPAELSEERREGSKFFLELKVYYRKENKRGMKLTIRRIAVNGGSTISLPFSSYNKTMHLQDMARKNDKIAQAFAEQVSEKFDQIAEIALESETPNFAAIYEVLAA